MIMTLLNVIHIAALTIIAAAFIWITFDQSPANTKGDQLGPTWDD